MQEQIKPIPRAVTVKNARLFFDNKRNAFRLIHYNDEILTVKVIEPITGSGQTDLEVINIFPVSASSINAIWEALHHLGIKESIDNICDKLDIDYRHLSYEFWGFDPHKRLMHYDPNRRSTFERGPFQRFNKQDWLRIQGELLIKPIDKPKSNIKYYLVDGFNGNDTEFRKVIKSSTYEAVDHEVIKIMHSYGYRKFEPLGSDPDGYIRYNKNGETDLSITIEQLEFKNEDDKQDTLKHYNTIWNGVYSVEFKEKYLDNMQPHHNEIVNMGDNQFNATVYLMKQTDITKCPFYILTPEHYRNNGSCKCDDPNDPNMKEWGYTWDQNKKRWTGSGDE